MHWPRAHVTDPDTWEDGGATAFTTAEFQSWDGAQLNLGHPPQLPCHTGLSLRPTGHERFACHLSVPTASHSPHSWALPCLSSNTPSTVQPPGLCPGRATSFPGPAQHHSSPPTPSILLLGPAGFLLAPSSACLLITEATVLLRQAFVSTVATT